MKTLLTLLLLAFLGPAVSGCHAQHGSGTAAQASPTNTDLAALEPDPRVQTTIDRLATSSNAATRHALEDELAHFTVEHPVAMVRQLICYGARHTEDTPHVTPAQAAAPYGLLVSLKLDRDSANILRAIEPVADTQDPALNKLVENLLDWAEVGGNYDPVPALRGEYRAYFRSYSHRRPPAPPVPLTVRIFLRLPGKALLACESEFRAYQVRESVALAVHTVDDYLWQKSFAGKYGKPIPQPAPAVLTQLQTLAADDTWWSRLYVAAILKEKPELRTPDLLKTLRADKDPYVQNALAAWDSSTPASQPAPAMEKRP